VLVLFSSQLAELRGMCSPPVNKLQCNWSKVFIAENAAAAAANSTPELFLLAVCVQCLLPNQQHCSSKQHVYRGGAVILQCSQHDRYAVAAPGGCVVGLMLVLFLAGHMVWPLCWQLTTRPGRSCI